MCGIINPVPTDLVCHMTHTVVLVVQYGTALDNAREGKSNNADDEDYDESRYNELIQYLEGVGKSQVSNEKDYDLVTKVSSIKI